MPDADVRYFPAAFNKKESEHFFSILYKETQWRADKIRIFGKWVAQPRLTALYAKNRHPYSYSGLTMHPREFTPDMKTLLQRVQNLTGQEFGSCLLNLYRDGKDSNGWHADDEQELGENPVIASVSFGQERIFHFRHKHHSDLKEKILLENGSLLLMKGATQHNWKHQLPKSQRSLSPRINLTFRNIALNH